MAHVSGKHFAPAFVFHGRECSFSSESRCDLGFDFQCCHAKCEVITHITQRERNHTETEQPSGLRLKAKICISNAQNTQHTRCHLMYTRTLFQTLVGRIARQHRYASVDIISDVILPKM